MFSKMYTSWIAGPALMLAMASNLLGVGGVSAQTLSANLSALDTTSTTQPAANGSATVGEGTTVTISGTSYGANEPIGLWINVPGGTAISEESLGQTDTHIVGTVIPLDAMGTADDAGDFTYNLDTTGLPSGDYSLVAHGLTTGTEEVLNFTIKPGPALQLTAGDNTTVPAGTYLTITGSPYGSDEAVGLWINVPNGTTISEDSLGQTDSHVVGTVIPLNIPGYADKDGVLAYTLDTSGLPSGTYSLVAHGLSTEIEGVLPFTIK